MAAPSTKSTGLRALVVSPGICVGVTGEVIGMVKIVAPVVVEIVYVGTVFAYVDVVHVDVVIERIVIAGGVVTAIVVAAVPSRITVGASSVIAPSRSMPAEVPHAETTTPSP